MNGLWGETEDIGGGGDRATEERKEIAVRERNDKTEKREENDTIEEEESEEGSSAVVSIECDDSEEGDLLDSLVMTAAKSGGFFKHQQVGEADISRDEKEKLVRDLLTGRPALFLQRFGHFLSEDQLDYFEDIRENDYEVQFYLNESRQFGCRKVREQRVKNRRYAMLQRMLQRSDPHFSETAMRERNPLLYEQLVGRFKTAEEKSADEAVDMTNCSLTNIILEHMDLNKERDEKRKMEEEEAEEEFDTDEEEEDDDDKNVATLAGGRDFLKQEFINAAYQSFLAGKDANQDYHKIDTDVTLDDLEAEEQEIQEKYFDESDENDE